MKTQISSASQSELGYREVMQNHNALSRDKKQPRRQIERLIRMAKSCSKSHSLAGTKKNEMKEIAETWQKLLTATLNGKEKK